MLILKCQWQICLINMHKYHRGKLSFSYNCSFTVVYLFMPFLSRVKLNFLSIGWIQWSLWFPMNIQGLFYHFTTFAWCVSQGRWIEVILQTYKVDLYHREYCIALFSVDPKFLWGIERLHVLSCLMETHLTCIPVISIDPQQKTKFFHSFKFCKSQ